MTTWTFPPDNLCRHRRSPLDELGQYGRSPLAMDGPPGDHLYCHGWYLRLAFRSITVVVRGYLMSIATYRLPHIVCFTMDRLLLYNLEPT